jgi:hypothetical protein
MTRIPFFSLSFLAVVSLVGCAGSKPNPRLSRIVEDSQGGTDTEIEFTYDGSGRIEKILQTQGEDNEQEWEFVWEGSELVSVKESVLVNAGERVDDETELTWEGRRLVEAERSGDSPDSNFTLEYDDQGRVDSIRNESAGEDQTTRFDYDNDGAVAELKVGDSGAEFDWDGDRLNGYDLEQGGETYSFDLTYDDENDRIESYVLKANTAELRYEVGYDSEGRVSDLKSEIEANGETVDGAEIEFEYDDGEAVGLDMASSAFIPLPFMVDMKGGAQRTIDNQLTVPRFVFSGF